MVILFIHYEIWRFQLWTPCFNRDTLMISILVLISQDMDCVSGNTILTTTNNIKAPLCQTFKVYQVLKALNLCFASMDTELLIHRIIILDLRRFWEIIAYLEGLYVAASYYVVGWRHIPTPECFAHRFSQFKTMKAWDIYWQ